MQNYISPLNNITLSFYIPYKENSNAVVIHRLQYNNTFFNIDYVNNYFAFLSLVDVNYNKQQYGYNIIDIPADTNTKQYILTIVRIPPGIYSSVEEIIKAINKSYREAYSDDSEKENKALTPLIGYKKETTTETIGEPRDISTFIEGTIINDDGSTTTTTKGDNYAIITTKRTDGTTNKITYRTDGTIITTNEQWIENINEDEKLIYFNENILPVNISLTIPNNIALTPIDTVLTNYYTKSANVLKVKDNKIYFEKASVNDNTYYTLYESYNNFSYNSGVSLSNYLTNIEYVLNISTDTAIKIREGNYINVFCFIGETIKTNAGEELNINLMEYNNVYSSRRRLEPNNLTEMDIKYTFSNNINELINKDVKSFNIIRERLDLTANNNFILPINGKVNINKSGVYIYFIAHNEITQVITNNACKLYYSYVI